MKNVVQGSVGILAANSLIGKGIDAVSAAIPAHKVVRAYNPAMIGGTSANGVVQSEVEKTLDAAMLSLTGETTVQLAWKAVFPNLTATQKVGIKVCCFSEYPRNNTKKEVVNAVIKRLQAFDVGSGQHLPNQNIIVYDLTAGYTNGIKDTTVLPDSQYQGSNDAPDAANGTVMCGSNAFVFTTILTQTIDYLINIPRLSVHDFGEITGALKSHVGSGTPPGNAHGNSLSDYIALINTPSFVKNKTKLIVYDSIYGVYEGGHHRDAQIWNTFTDNHSPSSLMVGQDPVAMDAVALSLIRAERTNRGLSAYGAGHVQIASQLGLGVYETPPFSQISYAVVNGATSITAQAPRYYHIPVVNAYPNPVRRGSGFHIMAAVEPGTRIEMVIYDTQGKPIRQLTSQTMDQGTYNFIWDGMDARGKLVVAGTYIVALQKGSRKMAKKTVVVN